MSEIGLRFPGIFQCRIAFSCGQVPVIFSIAMVSYDLTNFILFFGSLQGCWQRCLRCKHSEDREWTSCVD